MATVMFFIAMNCLPGLSCVPDFSIAGAVAVHRTEEHNSSVCRVCIHGLGQNLFELQLLCDDRCS